MPTASPEPVQAQGCGARHEGELEQDGDIAPPPLSLPALGWTGPSPAFPPFPSPPLAPPAPSPLPPLHSPATATPAPPGRDPGPIAFPLLGPPANREPPSPWAPGRRGRARPAGSDPAPAGPGPRQ